MCRTTTKKASAQAGELQKDEAWIADFDINAFAADINALGKKLEAAQGPADVKHLQRMVMWSNLFGLVGLLSMGWCVNLVSIVGLSTFTFSRWTMIAHHTCHGGYDRVHPAKGRWNRFKFAIGTFWRRFYDWFDWMMPEAWNVEHNNRHHYNLSEVDDPDLVEQNLALLRGMDIPVCLKYIMVGFFMTTWKWFYYAPNTYKELKLAKLRREGKPLPKGVKPEDAITFKDVVMGVNPFYSLTEFMTIVMGPYLVIHFLLTPLPFLVIEHFTNYTGLYQTAIINLVLAEILTNVHGFIAVVTNHAGDDMYRFRNSCRPFSGSFYLRQVLASVDFDMGNDATDFVHGWLNYQIEHHLWPNLSMLSYQKSAPLVRAVCKKHGVPYIKENVLIRLKKTIDIMVGVSTMRWFPEKYEALYLEKDAIVEAEKNARK